MEKLTWASEISLSAPFLIATGPGHLSWNPEKDLDALGSPADIKAKKLPGHLLCASTLLEVRDAHASRWLMLIPGERAGRPPGAQPPGWQFPRGYLGLDELPLHCAMRSLSHQVRLLEEETPLPWGPVAYRMGGPLFDWLTQDCVHTGVRARQVLSSQTVAFYYHAVLDVDDLGELTVQDNAGGSQKVALFTEVEISALQRQALVGGLSSMQWRAFITERDAKQQRLPSPVFKS